jgi:methyl-accepting chemotaxis protein
LEKLQAEYGLKLQDALGSSTAAHTALDSLAKASHASQARQRAVRRTVVMADTLDAPWQGFYDDVSQLMAQTYQLNTATLIYRPAVGATPGAEPHAHGGAGRWP